MLIINCNNEALSMLKRHPGANTYAYYPLIANANDTSGNSRNLTPANAITYSTTNGAYLPNSNHT